MFESKTVMKITFWLTRNGLRTAFTATELQMTEKLFKKLTKLKNPNMFLKTNFFENHNRLKISTIRDELNFNIS